MIIRIRNQRVRGSKLKYSNQKSNIFRVTGELQPMPSISTQCDWENYRFTAHSLTQTVSVNIYILSNRRLLVLKIFSLKKPNIKVVLCYYHLHIYKLYIILPSSLELSKWLWEFSILCPAWLNSKIVPKYPTDVVFKSHLLDSFEILSVPGTKDKRDSQIYMLLMILQLWLPYFSFLLHFSTTHFRETILLLICKASFISSLLKHLKCGESIDFFSIPLKTTLNSWAWQCV